MKKSELRQLIREEIQKLNEEVHKAGDVWPYGGSEGYGAKSMAGKIRYFKGREAANKWAKSNVGSAVDRARDKKSVKEYNAGGLKMLSLWNKETKAREAREAAERARKAKEAAERANKTTQPAKTEAAYGVRTSADRIKKFPSAGAAANFAKSKQDPYSKHTNKEPGSVWKMDDPEGEYGKWGAKSLAGNVEYFDDEQLARKWAKERKFY